MVVVLEAQLVGCGFVSALQREKRAGVRERNGRAMERMRVEVSFPLKKDSLNKENVPTKRPMGYSTSES